MGAVCAAAADPRHLSLKAAAAVLSFCPAGRISVYPQVLQGSGAERDDGEHVHDRACFALGALNKNLVLVHGRTREHDPVLVVPGVVAGDGMDELPDAVCLSWCLCCPVFDIPERVCGDSTCTIQDLLNGDVPQECVSVSVAPRCLFAPLQSSDRPGALALPFRAGCWHSLRTEQRA